MPNHCSSLDFIFSPSPIYTLSTMICQNCTRLLSPSILRPTGLRLLSTTSKLLRPESPPAATSTSAAQPFSTPFTPSPSKTPDIPSSPNTTSKATSQGPAHPPSSAPAGTPLRGLGYIKGQEVPVAREDSEYPDWLWGLLGPKQGDLNEEGAAGDAFGKAQSSTTAIPCPGRALSSGVSCLERSNGFNCLVDRSHFYSLLLHWGFEADNQSPQQNQKSNAASPPKPLAL